MATTVRVPLNTMLADLDETLKALLKRELGAHGFDGVEIAFDAPDKEWSAQLSSPTVSLFLYDLREAQDVRPIEWREVETNGVHQELRPPLRVDVSFAVTAWTREVQDEHRLLSQVLGILYAYPLLPDDVLTGTLANGSQQFPLRTRVAQARSDGGTQTIRLRDRVGGRAILEEFHRIGGVVLDADEAPVEKAWVVVDDVGWTVTDSEGRFRFDSLREGKYKLRVRGPDGSEAEKKFSVPGVLPDLTLEPAAKPVKAPAKRKS